MTYILYPEKKTTQEMTLLKKTPLRTQKKKILIWWEFIRNDTRKTILSK